MELKYKYFDVKELNSEIYLVENNRDEWLGHIEWYKPWSEFVFSPENHRIVLSSGCLEDLQDAIGKIEKRRKEE